MESRHSIRSHEKLEVWQDAMMLVEHIYQLTAGFPADERFGLVQQMRRASVSIPSNIAEGASRHSTKDYRRFLILARSSLCELETQIQIAARLNFMPHSQFYRDQCDKVFAKLSALIKSLSMKETEVRL